MGLIPLSVTIPLSKTFFFSTTKRSFCGRSFGCRKKRFFPFGDFHCNRGLLQTILLSILITNISFAQEDAWIYFKDKPTAESYFANPTNMLSQRALNRRILQNIPLDQKDIPINPTYITQIQSATGITVMAKSKWLNALHIRGTIQAIKALKTFAFVNYIDFADKSLNGTAAVKIAIRNKTKKVAATKAISKAKNTFNYGSSANQIQMLNGHLLHEQNYTGTGKIIAVLDSGFPGVDFAAPFQRLRDNNLVLGGYNFVNRGTTIYSADSHGTLVLSTMGSYVENQLIGTAPDASYYLCITEDTTSENPVEESYWVEAAEKADSLGVDIINSSLGYFEYDNPKYSYQYSDSNGTTSFVSRGADIAFTRGIIVVASAGNSGNSAEKHISFPADAVNVLTVGAVNATRQYVSFSSIGPTIDGRTKPDVMAKGQSATISNVSGTITTANGTSFSSPIIAGMVASLWQALPTKTNAEIVQLIKESANRFTTPTSQLGYGIPDFNKALQAMIALDDNNKEKLSFFPNPFQDQITLGFSDGVDNVSVFLFNSLGQLVFSSAVQKANPVINTTYLNSGIYFYKINKGNTVESGKLIKR